MLAALLPLFDENMSVSAYSLFSQRENLYLEPRYMVTGKYDNASSIAGLEVLTNVGLKTLSDGKDVFIPVDSVSIFSDIESQCNVNKQNIVIFIDKSIKPTKMYTDRLLDLKNKGYKLAVWKVSSPHLDIYKPILELMDYIFLNVKKIDVQTAKDFFKSEYPNINLIAGNIDSTEKYEQLKAQGGFALYEGEFYRIPVTKGQNEVAPVKLNYIELLNIVNDVDFDLTEAADVISRDTALVIELLKIVNKLSRNSEITTIRHAAAMLGQKELRKWIITAVAKKLCFDKPNEITRLSLIRAKFAENLASLFYLGIMEQELFILGLFSVLDIILDQPMEQALQKVMVSKLIREALIEEKGEFAQVITLIKNYEKADWSDVSKTLILNDFKMDDVYQAYLDALKWYRELFFDE